MNKIVFLLGLWVLFCTGRTFAQESPIEVNPDQACSNEVFVVVENPPTYKGGVEQLAKDLNDRLRFDKKVKESFLIRTLINCEGQLFLLGPFDPVSSSPLSQTSMALYELQHWQAGTQRTKAVDCYVNLWCKIKKGKIILN